MRGLTAVELDILLRNDAPLPPTHGVSRQEEDRGVVHALVARGLMTLHFCGSCNAYHVTVTDQGREAMRLQKLVEGGAG